MENNNNNSDTWGMFEELPEPKKVSVVPTPTTRNINPIKLLEVERVQKHTESKTDPVKAAKGRKEIFIPVVADEEKAKEFYESLKEDKKMERREKIAKKKSKKKPAIKKDKQEPKEEKPAGKRGRPRKYATPEESKSIKKKYALKYTKKNQTNIQIRLSTTKDEKVIKHIENQPNKAQYLRNLVIADMRNDIINQNEAFDNKSNMQRITHENGDEITLDEVDPDDLIERIFEYENILVSIGLIKK